MDQHARFHKERFISCYIQKKYKQLEWRQIPMQNLQIIDRYLYLTWLACKSLRDLFPAGATDVLLSVSRSYPPQLPAAATRRSYPPQLPAAATRFPSHGSGRLGLELRTATKLSSVGFEPTAVLTFGLRVRRPNHWATRSHDDCRHHLAVLYHRFLFHKKCK